MKKLFTLAILILIIGSFTTKAQAPHRKCGTMEYLAQQKAEDPTLELRMQNYEQALKKWIENNQDYINSSKDIITIPVVIHIVYNTVEENIGDNRVLEQINVLNRDFAGLNTHSMGAFSDTLKTNTELQFCLANRKSDGTATNGIERRQTTETIFTNTSNYVKFYSSGGLDAWDPTKYMNIWVCNLGTTLCGYSQFPTTGINATYGVVINYKYFGVTGALAPYNLGGTTTHEIGHCFNLYHIWGDDLGACTGTDYCDDTPNQANYTYGANTGVLTDACTQIAPGIQYMDFMDYSDDISYANFTPNQKERISALFVSGGLLYSLGISDGCTSPIESVCEIPTGLSVTSITASSATLNWSPVSEASSYNIQYRMSGTTTFTTITSATNSETLSGLADGTLYEFQVQAVCTNPGSYSGLTTFTTLNLCTDIYESNNTVRTAKTISTDADINALISTTTDVDYFLFSNTKMKKNISITLTNLPANYDVELYKSNGTPLIATSHNTGTINENIIYNNAPAGNYCIKVFGNNGAHSANACYTLTANISGSTYKGIGDQVTESNAPASIVLFPNPTNNKVNITYNSEKEANIVINIFDVTGRSVSLYNYQALKGLNSYTLNVSNLSKGIYILTLENNGVFLNEKLIIDK